MDEETAEDDSGDESVADAGKFESKYDSPYFIFFLFVMGSDFRFLF